MKPPRQPALQPLCARSGVNCSPTGSMKDRLNEDSINRSAAQSLSTTVVAALEGAVILSRAAQSTKPLEQIAYHLNELISQHHLANPEISAADGNATVRLDYTERLSRAMACNVNLSVFLVSVREAQATTGRGGRGAGRRILDTATELFYHEGINATGVERLASEASVSKRTLYQHFPSKTAVVEEYLRAIQQGVGDPIQPGPDADRHEPRARILALFDSPPAGGPMRGCSSTMRPSRPPKPCPKFKTSFTTTSATTSTA